MKNLIVVTMVLLVVGSVMPLVASMSIYVRGDANHDGYVDRADLRMVLANWGACPDIKDTCDGDVNFDGMVDVEDLKEVLTNWNPKPKIKSADLNYDGKVNVEDLVLLVENWGKCAGCDADLNSDGEVDRKDLRLLIRQWTQDDLTDGPHPLIYNEPVEVNQWPRGKALGLNDKFSLSE